MTTKLSTGLRDRILDSGSLKARLAGGFIDIYSGTIPATPNDSVGAAVKLVRISNNGTSTGLTFEEAAPAGDGTFSLLYKKSTEEWSGICTVAGTASFYRYVKTGDTGAASDTQERIQGTVAIGGLDIDLPNLNFQVGGEVSLSAYLLAFVNPS